MSGAHVGAPDLHSPLLLLLLLAASLLHPAAGQDDGDFVTGAIHTIFSTDCKRFFAFQTLALAHSFAKAGQPGNLTRIASCTRQQLSLMRREDRDMVQTHIAPSWEKHPTKPDDYPPYNKPTGVMDWLDKANPREEWILMVDPDMLFRAPLTPETLGVADGWSAGAHYSYLNGVINDLALRHVRHVAPRNDTYGGPRGRRADRVGHYCLVRNADLRRMAPFWLKFTEDVRFDPDAWNLTGDSYVEPGDRPWISEMYGYAYAAAHVGVWHKLNPGVQAYPSYAVWDSIKVIHYGLTHRVGGYGFDKHDHYYFNSFRCPPWNMSMERDIKEDYGLFPHPPHPSELAPKDNPQDQYGALLVVEFVNTINEGLCERHKKVCPASEQLKEECGTVEEIQKALAAEFAVLDAPDSVCVDALEIEKCLMYLRDGLCEKEWLQMGMSCRKTCGRCFGASMRSPPGQTVVANVQAKEPDTFSTEGNVGKSEDATLGNISISEKDEGNVNQDISAVKHAADNEHSSPSAVAEERISNTERERARCRKLVGV
ncbi:unnamed protein product [Ostreobium quekettii]|uniref:ShKT domain-containing protein n=1 Tax=Ostreobium quekettii TaxID=121088 RepID=A0A8S1IRA6_9CHLO|nr:unnamed protein product [Ostreobium quekettii]